MRSLRLFIAIEMPAEIRQALSELRETLAGETPPKSVRWVAPENIHLTLKFLGDTDATRAPAVGNRLEEIAAGHAPFELRLGALGCFPNPRKPRVIWLGVDGDVEQLADLQQDVESAMASMGWQRENRRYHPHLTLGRVKESQQVVQARLPWGQQPATGQLDVTEFHLIESDLRPGGAVYTSRSRAVLASPSDSAA